MNLNEKIKLYEQQTVFVENFVNEDSHPEFIEVLNSEERKIFEYYFMPDWDKIKDFRDYYHKVTKEDPALEKHANQIFVKFLDKNGFRETKDLLLNDIS